MTEGWLQALRAAFRPDFEAGTLIRIECRQRPDLVGTEAGYVDNWGYVRVAFKGRKYLRSHLLFALFHGRLPVGQLDHINRNRTDDRPENLREVSHAENMWNRTPKKRDLPMGVTFKEGKYQARIMCNRRRYRLGTFDTIREAQDAYLQKRKELFGEYA